MLKTITFPKLLLLLLWMAIFAPRIVCAQSATDSTSTKEPPVILELGLYSQYVWRGISFGAGSPSVQALIAKPLGNFEIGAYAASTLRGNKEGYGNTLEIYASYTAGNFTFTIDDYFFFEPADSLNDYFNYGNDTPHFIEGRVAFEKDKFSAVAGYTLHSRSSDETTGLYLEASYAIHENITFTIGGVTAPSFLNFMDKAGITNIGLHFSKPLVISQKLETTAQAALIVNPNHNFNAPVEGVGRSPVLFVASLIF